MELNRLLACNQNELSTNAVVRTTFSVGVGMRAMMHTSLALPKSVVRISNTIGYPDSHPLVGLSHQLNSHFREECTQILCTSVEEDIIRDSPSRNTR